MGIFQVRISHFDTEDIKVFLKQTENLILILASSKENKKSRYRLLLIQCMHLWAYVGACVLHVQYFGL